MVPARSSSGTITISIEALVSQWHRQQKNADQGWSEQISLVTSPGEKWL
jgi:hypothetical protein